VADEETFFRDLILPTSAKYVEICFCRILNSFSFGAAAPIHSLKEDVKSADFHERWSRLKNLEPLHIIGSDIDFAQELLKSSPQLRVLKLGRVKLGSRAESFDVANFSSLLFLLRKLERVKVKGKWDINEFKNYMVLFKNNHTSRENRVIEFRDILYSQSEEFFQFLEQLNSVSRAEDGLEMSFHIQVKSGINNKWKDAFIKQLQEFTERGRPMKNVSLTLMFLLPAAALFNGQLDKFKAFGKLFKRFEY